MTYLLLILIFAFVAFFYSLIGFGGGSSYVAILSLAFFKVPYFYVPLIALFCNLIVTGKATYSFLVLKKIKFSHFLYFIPSLLFAFVGALIPVTENIFFSILGTLLVISGILIYFDNKKNTFFIFSKAWKYYFKQKSFFQKSIFITLVFISIGFLAGITGIGGGIYLAPILHNFTRLKVLQIAALTSGFIFCNSLFGLMGQMIKLESTLSLSASSPTLKDSLEYGLFSLLLGTGLAVAVGGSLGNSLTINYFKTNSIKKLTGIFTFVVGLYVFIRAV